MQKSNHIQWVHHELPSILGHKVSIWCTDLKHPFNSCQEESQIQYLVQDHDLPCLYKLHKYSRILVSTCIVFFSHLILSLYSWVFLHHRYAFWKMRNHGDACRSLRQSEGIQGHCQVRVQRSGWGIMARWRPSGEQSAAIPSGEPLGLRGYWLVGLPLSSTYWIGAKLLESTEACTDSLANFILPVGDEDNRQQLN